MNILYGILIYLLGYGLLIAVAVAVCWASIRITHEKESNEDR
jgi:hypothetical protein